LQRPFQRLLGYFKTYEVVIVLRRVISLGQLGDVELEFDLQVRYRVVGVVDNSSEAKLQLGINQRDRLVDRFPMAVVVGRVVRQRSQGERVFVQIRGRPEDSERSPRCEHDASDR